MERRDWIETHGAQCWNIAGCECDGGKHNGEASCSHKTSSFSQRRVRLHPLRNAPAQNFGAAKCQRSEIRIMKPRSIEFEMGASRLSTGFQRRVI